MTDKEIELLVVNINQKIDQFIESHEREAEPMRKTVALLDQCIRGNGKEGIATKVGRMEDRMAVHDRALLGGAGAILLGAVKMIFGGK